MSAKNLSKKLRMAVQPLVKFRQLCDVKDATQQGKKKGDTYHWDVFSDVATQGTVLTETTTMPETQFVITQGTLTVDEFGNSVPYTGKLDDLSELPVTTIINKVLKNDAKKAFDIAAEAQFSYTPLHVCEDGSSTTAINLMTASTNTDTASVALGVGHVKAIRDAMVERNIPPYVSDDYYAISWPTTLRTFKDDLEGVSKYTPEGFAKVMNGEIGRYEKIRFIEQTNIAKDATTSTDWCYFMGDDTVCEAIVVPEEMRGKIPGDYGRSKGVAWYYLGGFGLVHTAQLQARIIRWGSTA
jgi:N4-gp56 family major capsid protein